MSEKTGGGRSFGIRHDALGNLKERFTFFYGQASSARHFFSFQHESESADLKNFVLGGIALREGHRLAEFEQLRMDLGLGEQSCDIGFSWLGSASFEQALDSAAVGVALGWLLNHRALIHYSTVNIVDWSVSDIVNAPLADARLVRYAPLREHLKNELRIVANLGLFDFLELLRHYGYPEIHPHLVGAFLEDLGRLLSRFAQRSALSMSMLRNLINQAARLADAPLVPGARPSILMEGFGEFYARLLLTFKNATHIFERGMEAESRLNGLERERPDAQGGHCFQAPERQPGLQLAAVVVALIASYYSFINERPLQDLLTRKRLWRERQVASFQRLQQLIDRSKSVSDAFIFRSRYIGETSMWRDEVLLHGARCA